MVDGTATKKYSFFGLGLNYKDDENELREGETPFAINNDISSSTGLASIRGLELIWPEINSKYHIRWFGEYKDAAGNYRWVAVSYPNILLINPANGSIEVIYRTWYNTGEPFGRQVNDDFFLVDGTYNKPLFISGRTVTELAWPPAYTNDNNDPGSGSDTGNIVDSYLNQGSEQKPLAGNPEFFAYHKNRLITNDASHPRRLLFSKASDLTDFSDNDPSDWNIAFFLDIPAATKITALEVLSNKYLVIYCENEIIVMEGDNPPGVGYEAPLFAFSVVNSSVGALHHNLVAKRGDNDHFFVANNGRIYTLESSDNFQEAKPRGLTDKIFRYFEGLDNETLKRGKLLNHEIRSELVYWIPEDNNRRYPNRQLVLNYGSSTNEPVWSLRVGFGDYFRFKFGIIDRDDRMIICKDGNRFLQMHSGTSFDGEPIQLLYQFPAEDFERPNNNKQVTRVTAYGNTPEGALLQLGHLWENGKEGLTPFSLDARALGLFDDPDTLFDTDGDLFTSDVGLPFQKKTFAIANRYGKKLKMRVEHISDEATVNLGSLVLDYRLMGK